MFSILRFPFFQELLFLDQNPQALITQDTELQANGTRKHWNTCVENQEFSHRMQAASKSQALDKTRP